MKKASQKSHPNSPKKRRKIYLAIGLLLLAFYWFSLPNPLFTTPYSLVLEDSNGGLLGARIATDGQWRFPASDSLPAKYVKALLTFEDKRFYKHPGVDILSLFRAIRQNISAGRIVSGGSTINMQVIRMARQNPPRTVWQKVIEIVLATRLELGYSKDHILQLYSAHAPFGGNVVGLEAASWRYLGKSPHLISWAEAAMLAVLPNSPGLIHPSKNRALLKEKRNRLLDKLLETGNIDSLSWELSKEEPLPQRPYPLPQWAPHLIDRIQLDKQAQQLGTSRIRTSINNALQQQLNQILQFHHGQLRRNEINNLAALIIDIESGAIIAYAGNVIGAGELHHEAVDVVRAPRSTGSILKPFLYGLMLQEGSILPGSLISDVPMTLKGYRPENFNEQFDGAIPAKKAIIRSLNVPLVKMLQQYGLEKFHFQLQEIGLTTITKGADHYGLPLVLGGAEATLEEITNAYACMARTLQHFPILSGAYSEADFRPATYLGNQPSRLKATDGYIPPIGAAACWHTFDAMQQVERPDAEGQWARFQSNRKIAWKTGTSFGFRDAWAVGLNTQYAVGVWAGNADGEGRPGLIGVKAAAPVLFDIFNRLPTPSLKGTSWFPIPYDDMVEITTCRKSGYRALPICEKDTLQVPATGVNTAACPYHRTIHLDATGQFQVNSACANPNTMQHRAWFVLPPLEEYYFKSKHPEYALLPAFAPGCQGSSSNQNNPMQLIYPKYPTEIYVPLDLDGERSKTVFKVAHRQADLKVYWHIDDEFIGTTTQFHSMELAPPPGEHVLTLVDANGFRLVQAFTIIDKPNKK